MEFPYQGNFDKIRQLQGSLTQNRILIPAKSSLAGRPHHLTLFVTKREMQQPGAMASYR